MHRKGAVGFIVSIRSCPRRQTFGVTLYFATLFPKLAQLDRHFEKSRGCYALFEEARVNRRVLHHQSVELGVMSARNARHDGESSTGPALRLRRSRGALPLQFFLTKARTSFCKDRIYFWSNGDHTRLFSQLERHRFMCRSFAFRRNPARPAAAAGCVVLYRETPRRCPC